jgi:hypothetical protein
MAVLENYCWATLAGAIKMQAISAEVDQFARRMELRGFLLACATFVTPPEKCNDHECHNFSRKQHPEATREISS